MGKEDLLILDEAVWHLLDEVCDIPACFGVIGMTATDVGNEGGIEQQRLAQLGFKVHNSGI